MKRSKQKNKIIAKVFSLLYNILIVTLAIGSIALAILDICNVIDLSSPPLLFIDAGILIIFTIDYIIRFLIAKDKQYFFKHNICDLIALIPFSSMFSAFRITRTFRIVKITKFMKLFRLVRVTAFFSMLRKKAKGILETNGFLYVLYASGVLLMISSLIMMFVEHQSFEEALWWSIVTCTTVGYGDISPSTRIERVVAIVLMLFGIGLISMLTSSITTYFTTPHKNKNAANSDELQQLIKDMDPDELEKLTEIAKILKK